MLLPETMRDPIPQSLQTEYSLCGLRFALENIHFPSNTDAIHTARRRLIFEELLILQLGLFLMKEKDGRESRFPLQRDYTQEFLRLLPFSSPRHRNAPWKSLWQT